jgi:Leucine-rich repeat (LRR) protein
MQDTTLATLPAEIIALVHSWLLHADPTRRSCLALEATCQHLRSVLLSNTRFEEVSVDARHLDATVGCDRFWRWIAAHGRRTGTLRLQHLELLDSTPQLCSHAGVLQARAVAVSAAVIDTLEPLRGLLNLAAVEDSTAIMGLVPYCAVSLAPLAGLPALERVTFRVATMATTSLAPLSSMAALTSLTVCNTVVPQLDDLSSLRCLRDLRLLFFHHVTSVAPLSCLTALTHASLAGLSSLHSVGPLHALRRLRHLTLCIRSTQPISLQPLCQLTLLTALFLRGSRPGNMTNYDLQPVAALSMSLRVLDVSNCVLQNPESIVSLGTTLQTLSVMGCECPPGFQHASLIPRLQRLTSLSISDATAADLDSIGRQLKRLQRLTLSRADTITSLAALAPLTRLRSITLQSCSHISSIAPLAALTQLKTLRVFSCPQLISLQPLTALQSLWQLRLEG